MSRLTLRLGAAALTALALAAPVASASAIPADLRAPHPRGPGHAIASAVPLDLRSPDARSAAQTTGATGSDLRTPDARAAGQAVTTGSDLRSPDARDLRRGPVETPPVTAVVTVDDGGLDWGDAGIGAAVAAVFAGALALTARRRRHVPALRPVS